MYLLEQGAALTEKDEIGRTALLCAADNGHTETVGCLLEKGASLTEKDKFGRTALLVAVGNGHTETVGCLLEHGASLTDKTNDGHMALTLAFDKGHWTLAEFLLFHYIDAISEQDKKSVLLRLNLLNIVGSITDTRIMRLVRCMHPEFPRLRVTESTLTVTAEILTAEHWLDIIELLKQYPAIRTLRVEGGRRGAAHGGGPDGTSNNRAPGASTLGTRRR